MEKNKGTVIIYDRQSIPAWCTMGDVINFKEATGVVIYDSTNGGDPPKKCILGKKRNDPNRYVEILDVK